MLRTAEGGRRTTKIEAGGQMADGGGRVNPHIVAASVRDPALLALVIRIFGVMILVPEMHRANLAGLCRRFKVRRLALFGSATRADFDSSRSDVDFLVEFEDPHGPGYADRYLDFALAAEILLGRRVDFVTVRSIVSPVFKQRIEADTVELDAA